ncbi:MAG TPA: hypothetical protein VHQ24_03985 [Lachnospiraceae bacterium]|nr:hypothetical protein [Lachnospiraceae bacterium]
MIFLVIAIAVIVVLMIFSRMEERNRNLLWREKLRADFGQSPEQEYTEEYFNGLKGYYNHIRNGKCDIDDITFNDLDMKQIFMVMNNTSSSVGEEYLYALMRQLCFDEDTLRERNRMIQYFLEHEKERIDFQLTMHHLGKLTNISIYEFINRMKKLNKFNNTIHYLCIGSLIAALGTIAINPGIGILLSIAAISHNIYQYYKRKAAIDDYVRTIAYIVRMIDCVDELKGLKNQFLNEYVSKIDKASGPFQYVKRNAKWISGGRSMNGSLIDSIMDYERMLFHTDLIKFNRMVDTVNSNTDNLNTIFETIGFLESMVAAASFRAWLDYYCEPILERNRKPFIKVNDIYHPLIDNPICNSIDEYKSVLITGSNASGKSTFIKTLAINAILSQTIFTSTSSSYHANYYRVYSSMALRDDLFNNESYYIVEIKSLKRILDAANDELPILCFVDEVLRGTNTLERIAASAQILSSLAKEYVLCFAATHDIELTHILEKHFSNYHFQEEVVDNQIKFDYTLYEGRAISRNAIKLLSLMGYSKQIIDQATMAANDFLEKGVWDRL